jgi:hypothetical protein
MNFTHPLVFTRVRDNSLLELAYKELITSIDTRFLHVFSDLYVLALKYDNDDILINELDETQQQALKHDGYFIIGFMLLDDTIHMNRLSNVQYILDIVSILDTGIYHTYNTQSYMIQAYEALYQEYVILIPEIISETTMFFWHDYFKMNYNITNSHDLEVYFKHEHEIKNVYW